MKHTEFTVLLIFLGVILWLPELVNGLLILTTVVLILAIWLFKKSRSAG